MLHRKFVFCLLLINFTLFTTAYLGQTVSPQNARPLILNSAIEDKISAGETKTFSIHLEKNQFAVFSLEQKGIDAVLAINDAGNGKQLLEQNINTNKFGTERIMFQSETEPRDLLIRVLPAQINDPISSESKFSLKLTELKTANDRDKLRLAAQTAVLSGLKISAEEKPAEPASGFYEKALKSARESGDSILEADILALLQRTSNETNAFKKSIEYGEAALPLFIKQGHRYDLATVKYHLGYSLITTGEIKRGLEILPEALAVQREFGDHKAEGATLLIMAFALRGQGEVAKGAELADQSYQAAKAANDKEGQSYALMLGSGTHFDGGDFLKAIELLNIALPLAEETKSESIINIYNELGRNSDGLGQEQKALDYYLKALSFQRQFNGRKFNEATLLNNIGRIYSVIGQYRRALDYNRQGVQILNELGFKQATVEGLHLNGVTHLYMKDYEKAKESLAEALKLSEQGNFRGTTGQIYHNLGVVELSLNHLEAAAEYFQKAAQIQHDLKMRRLESVSLNSMSDVYVRLGQFEKAAEPAGQALEMSRATSDRLTESDSLYILAGVRRGQNDLIAALRLIEDSIKIVESLRADLISQESRAAYFSKVRVKYDFYVDLLIQLQNQTAGKEYGAQAYAVSERARARSLLDLLAEAHVDVSEGISPALKSREQAIAAQLSFFQTRLVRLKSAEKPDAARIANLQKDISQADNEREQLESEIRRRNPRYAGLKYPTTLSLEQTQAMLDDRTLFLEYQTGREGSFLFAIGKNESQIVNLPKEQTLREAVEALRKGISVPTRVGLSNYLVNGRSLYQTLLKPVENLLKTKNKIIISADGALNYLPFEVLLTDNSEKSLDKLPYLLRDFEISYTPSASVLMNLKGVEKSSTVKPPKSFLAFAAPEYGGAKTTAQNQLISETRGLNLVNLQYAKAEAESIAKLFPAGQSTIFTGTQATEDLVESNELLAQYRYLHFAVHGLINEEQPQFSSLVLAIPKIDQSSTQNAESKIEHDGLLQTPEIFNLRLRADLVTLSACETGLGQELRGEGLVGLTRAFFYAGASSVVVSLWKVDDASTANLMTLFYEQLRKDDGRNKAAALRQAQLKFIAGNRYAHPYYWAPFVLQGKSVSNP